MSYSQDELDAAKTLATMRRSTKQLMFRALYKANDATARAVIGAYRKERDMKAYAAGVRRCLDSHRDEFRRLVAVRDPQALALIKQFKQKRDPQAYVDAVLLAKSTLK